MFSEKKLTIVHIAPSNNQSEVCIAHSVRSLVRQQADWGHVCKIITVNDQKIESYKKDGLIDIHYVPKWFQVNYRDNKLFVPWRAYHYIHAILSLSKPDIIHIHDPLFLGHTVIRFACKYKIPTIFTYDLPYHEYINQLPLPRYIAAGITKFLIRRFANKLYHIIVPNKEFQHVLRIYESTTQSTVIPYFIDQALFPSERPAHKKFQCRSITLLVVSRFLPKKRLEKLIDCFDALSLPAHLIFAGSGYWKDHLIEYCQQFRFPLLKKISWYDNPSNEQLKSLYQDADLLLSTCVDIEQSKIIAQAMTHNTPVIGLAHHSKERIIKNDYNGFLTAYPDQMAHVIESVMKNEKLFIKLQNGAYETSLAYDPKIIAQKILNQYYETLHLFKEKM